MADSCEPYTGSVFFLIYHLKLTIFIREVLRIRVFTDIECMVTVSYMPQCVRMTVILVPRKQSSDHLILVT